LLITRYLRILIPVFGIAWLSAGRSGPGQGAGLPVDRVVDNIVRREAEVVRLLERTQPIAETYIQLLSPDAPNHVVDDVYFIGKIDLQERIDFDVFTPPPARAGFRSRFAAKTRFLPRGFAQMTLPDRDDFNQDTYEFHYVRREFQGDLRCLVFDVLPRQGAGWGRFLGRIWVEDQKFYIVRFSGTYTSKSKKSPYFHLNSWRVQTGTGAWAPAYIYVEETGGNFPAGRRPAEESFRGQVRIWGYKRTADSPREERTRILVEAPLARDESEGRDSYLVETRRNWEAQAEANIIERMERADLLAPAGGVDTVLQTVVNNLLVSNAAALDAPVRCRVLLTTPIESFTVGRTIVLSRGLIDSLPDEASLAMVLASELAHILLGHPTSTRYAFGDRILIEDSEIFQQFRFRRGLREWDEANRKALELLEHSPYKPKIASARLFLRQVEACAAQMPNLFQARIGDPLAENGKVARMAELMESAPPLEPENPSQVAALPLGSRVKVDPWTNRIALGQAARPRLAAGSGKMAFLLTPLMLPLSRRIVPAMAASGSGFPGKADSREEIPRTAGRPQYNQPAVDPQNTP
jgi:hypothetical protein